MRLRQERAARRGRKEGGKDSHGAKWKGNQDKLCFIIVFLALALNSWFHDLGLESQLLLLTTLNLVLMLDLLLLRCLGLCLVSQTLHWLTPLALNTFCCLLKEFSCFPVPWEPSAHSQYEQRLGEGSGQ